jgi:DNA polymerase-3 subunit delta'
VFPFEVLEHADMRWISTPEDKKSIGIEQIRELASELSLTSYEGMGKVAVIEPANDMTANAANSLLKTLEEPPGDALLVLVADRVGKLPATIFSRCQRIDIPIPGDTEALQWLDRHQPGASWAEALRMVGGAPLAALSAIDDLETSSAMGRDLQVLGSGRGSPVEVAARWAKQDPHFVLNWLARQVKLAVLAGSAGRDAAAGLAIDNSVLRRMDRRNLFCYLDIINRLRGQPGGSYNVQLSFEGLLIDWAAGLAECGPAPPTDGLELMLKRR